MTIDLRPYQLAAAENVARVLAQDPAARMIVEMATGSGKTKLGLSLLDGLKKRALWVAHTDELIEQPLANATELLPHLRCGVVKARRDDTGARDVVFASRQTLQSPERLARLVDHQKSSGPIEFVVVDEVHHASPQSSYHRILDAFPGVPALGLSATPERTDKRPVGKLFPEGIIFKYGIKAATDEGWLVPLEVRPIRNVDIDWDEIGRAGGDFDKDDLQKQLMRAEALKAVAGATAEAVGEGLKTVVFCHSIEQARAVAERCREEHGVRCEVVSGDLAQDERRRVLGGHRRGEFPALASFNVILEGYDDPTVTGGVWARPTLSRSVFIQGAGRLLRPCAPIDKKRAVLWDLVGAYPAHGLVGGDQIYLDGDPVAKPATGDLCDYVQSEVGWFRDERNPGALPTCSKPLGHRGEHVPKVRVDHEKARLRNFLAYLAGQRELAGVTTESSVRWLVAAPGQAIALSAGDDGLVLVERCGDDAWQAVLEPRDRNADPRLLTHGPTSLEIAQTVGENFARTLGAFRLSARDATWRRREPSEKIIRMLDAFRVQYRDGITAGEAADLATIAVGRARFNSRRRRAPVPFNPKEPVWCGTENF